jgi:hypothetical protein
MAILNEMRPRTSSLSFQNVLSKHNNIGPGFDLMRISLALAILYDHCFYIAVGSGGTYLTKIASSAAAADRAGPGNLHRTISGVSA